MKFKCIATITLVVGLVFIASCGTNLSGGVTLAQARSTCVEWAKSGSPDPEQGTTSLILQAEARRDAGETNLDWILLGSISCSNPAVNNNDSVGCTACVNQIGAVVWK